MARNNIDGVFIRDSFFAERFKLGLNIQSIVGNISIAAKAPPLHFITPDATRVVTLPAYADSKGLVFVIVNKAAGAFDLTINNPAAGLVGTISQNEMAILVCDGVSWAIGVGTTT